MITDSTAHLTVASAERYSIRVVPLHVLADGVTALDGVEFSPECLLDALLRHQMVTTSRPTPEEFIEVFRSALAQGADQVVSIHLSRLLSGTWESAVLAARVVGEDRVRVVDSRSTAMGLGFAVVHAATAAANGATAEEVESIAVSTAEHSKTLFALDTLEYLRRGGRIGAAGALLGTALAIKPLLYMDNGHIRLLEKVRTSGRALSRLVDIAVDQTGEEPVEIAIHHLGALQRAEELSRRLRTRLPRATGFSISQVGAVIGAHTGPGVLGVVVQRKT